MENNKKIIYGIEFETVPSTHRKGTISSKNFKMLFLSFESGKSSLNVVFSNPTTSFHVERNTVEQTFLDFFTICPKLKSKEFDDLRRTFFENFGKETENTAYAGAFGKPSTLDDFNKNLPPIESITS